MLARWPGCCSSVSSTSIITGMGDHQVRLCSVNFRLMYLYYADVVMVIYFKSYNTSFVCVSCIIDDVSLYNVPIRISSQYKLYIIG
jgi:hypothetical protein